MRFKQQQERNTKDLNAEEFNKAVFDALTVEVADSAAISPKDWGQNCAEQMKKELVYRAELRSCYINATRRLETLLSRGKDKSHASELESLTRL